MVLLLLLCLTYSTFADIILMNNGDKISGKIVRKEGDKLFVETEIAGIIGLKWSMVKEIVSDSSMAVTLDDGNVIEGRIAPEGEIIKVETKEETFEVPRKEIKEVRTPNAQVEFEKAQKKIADARITDLWNGTLDVGFSLTNGNSDTHTFSAAMRAVREIPHKKISAYANAVQVKDTSTNVTKVRAQSVWAGARYEVDFRTKWFAFASGDFEYNQPQKLNLRAVLGTGFGYHTIKRDHLSLDISAGVTNNYENFSTGLVRNSAELSLGEELKYHINSRARLTERAVFYPNLSQIGQARALLDASLETDISSWLGWHVTIGNRFNSRPVNLTENNDFIMSTGLRFFFGNKRKKLGK